jgi:hypothetical protein
MTLPSPVFARYTTKRPSSSGTLHVPPGDVMLVPGHETSRAHGALRVCALSLCAREAEGRTEGRERVAGGGWRGRTGACVLWCHLYDFEVLLVGRGGGFGR